MDHQNKNAEQTQSYDAVLELFKPFEHFSKCLLDAFVIIDPQGKILKCNQLFTSITGMKSRQILKAESLDHIFSLTISGNPIGVKEFVSNVNPTRYDEVICKCLGKEGELNLIIGLYPLMKQENLQGVFLLVRDVTAEASLQDKYKDKATKSITDALTGLFNRNYFIEYMASQVSKLEDLPLDAPQRLVSLIMMDIDFFKKINDRFGHPAGDAVLKETAQLMRNMFRKTDIVARYGGEEFLIILPSTDAVGALTAAEKVRLALQQYKFTFEDKVIPVTISSGVALIEVGRETGEQTMARADAALYFSKKNGRNQVSFHSGDGVIPASQISGINLEAS